MAPSLTDIALGEQVIAAWTRVWGLRQLAPFTNALLGIAGGAIDNWPLQGPLSWWHWHVRLPTVLISMVWPSPLLAFSAHACNLAFLAATMPFVWDHMMWASLHDVAFVAAMLTGCFAASPWGFLAGARAQTIISYLCSAFWKLTTSFLDPRYSCGTLLVAELLSILPGPLFPPHGLATGIMLRAAPLITIVTEFAIPVLLAFCPHAGVLLGIFFHLTIFILPVNAAGGFSITCATSYFFFVPQGMVLAWENLSNSMVCTGVAGAVTAIAFAGLRGTGDVTFAIYLTFATLLVYAIFLERRNPALEMAPRAMGWKFQLFAVSLAVCHGLLGPILGLQNMGSLTMYGNVKHWGGSNHLLVPTGLLLDVFADVRAETPLFGAFAGGIVRVDTSDLPADLLRSPADATNLLPAHVRNLMKGVGNPGIFYAPYYARMASSDFFEDVDSGMDWSVQPFAVPAFELRRLLALARARGEPFMLRYTRLPREARTPGQWMRHKGPQVLVQEDPREGTARCIIDGDGPCAADELAVLPPPPRWFTASLLPYPIPLLDVNGTEIPCVS
ncbi:unnamed protein product [Polarella glacialis]|uniref:Uncharacterized protein n=1 Tax=Polarella glacialis TaxID=89957 RepID=A0A813GSD8_POLGL|nr:unnamed protein product [Polarella glacialis]